MRKILPQSVFTDEQLNNISSLVSKTGLCRQTVEILFSRGIDDEEKISKFFHPSKSNFISPFKMSGMAQAVNLINKARAESWKVVVYGDYDADGVCASVIMSKALRDYGIDVSVYVPERKNGYGLSQGAIDGIFEDCFPQLFITVDCGISNAEEVEYIKEQGAEVIVTDHHELPDKLPDCICINPKFNDGYPYDNLCGAGVAFKVGCALNGSSAYRYLDFAAIATVADSVPLTGENRDIVTEGLKLINSSPSPCYSAFLKPNEAVNAQTLAFNVAPKINAAGRMGDANAALKLFCSEDRGEIFTLSSKLGEYNLERQRCCDELYLSAKKKIAEGGADGRVIMLWDEDWNTGFVGIVAARLAEEYSRPALLFVKNGDLLKGSARSVEGVNIFEALKACSKYISEFGGHSQAAGVNITQENFSCLYAALEKYLEENYTSDAFVPDVYVNGKFDGEPSIKLIKELEMFEPCGVGNKRPTFYAEAGKLNVKQLKSGSPHLAFKVGNLDMTFFSGLKYYKYLTSAARKNLIFEYNISSFRGKESVKGLVRDLVSGDTEDAEEDVLFNNISVAALSKVECDITYITIEEAEKMLFDSEPDAVFVVNDGRTVESYKHAAGKSVNLFTFLPKNSSSAIIISPSADCDFSGFNKVVYLDNPHGVRLQSLNGKKVYICKDIDGLSALKGLDCDRETLVGVFREVSAASGAYLGISPEEAAKSLGGGAQTLFALEVFTELNLLNFDGGKVKINRGNKTALTCSPLYNFVEGLKN